ncbi:MAG: response regulator [Gammaproteobacteria bacterium]|jgi:DNA-binding response OmpR family regulator
MESSRATILIVDDEPVNIDTICGHLANDDFDLVTASDGRQAMQLLESNPARYDVVILDRMMPGLDGMEVLGNIKENESTEHIPVLMQTAKDADQEVVEGLRAGAYYHLTRPYDGEVLKTVVRSAVNNRIHEKSLHESLRQGRRIFDLMSFGRFRMRDLHECNLVASQVAHLCPEPYRVVTGISELLVNALEHGNLGIGYEEKNRLIRSGMWRLEVDRRLGASENRGRYVELEFTVFPERVQIRVRDQGRGFDWAPYLKLDPDRAFDPHGRGIAVARMSSFDDLQYIGSGNEVLATINKKGRS